LISQPSRTEPAHQAPLGRRARDRVNRLLRFPSRSSHSSWRDYCGWLWRRSIGEDSAGVTEGRSTRWLRFRNLPTSQPFGVAFCRPDQVEPPGVKLPDAALVAQGIEHRFPKPFWGSLPTRAMGQNRNVCGGFRLSSSFIISHVFTPVAAQVRPKPTVPRSTPAVTAAPSRSLNAYGGEAGAGHEPPAPGDELRCKLPSLRRGWCRLLHTRDGYVCTTTCVANGTLRTIRGPSPSLLETDLAHRSNCVVGRVCDASLRARASHRHQSRPGQIVGSDLSDRVPGCARRCR